MKESQIQRSMTDMFKVNLSQIKTPPKKPVYDSIQIGNYTIKTTEPPEGLTISKIEDGNEKVIIDILNYDVMIHGKSINAIWKTLENHYEALKSLIEQK